MNFEAITICVNYADFLAEAAKQNVGLLDRWLIVTTPDDEATREVCRIHDLETLISEDHRRNDFSAAPLAGSLATRIPATHESAPDPAFNKGRMIDRGLQMLSQNSWRLHLDADVVLPSQFRRMIAGAHLDEQKIYGADRIMVRGWDQWQSLLKSGWMNHTHCAVNLPQNFQIGTRWALASSGYIPIGFFQLWHAAADEWRGRRHRPYPIAHGSACRTDVQHALQWDRRQRELIPEIVVAHLESGPGKLGANWRGRTTPQFGPFNFKTEPREPTRPGY